MTGICEKCKKPLMERYDGHTFCPHCGTAVEEKPLCITMENEEVFKLSELCFLRYLAPQKGSMPAPNQRREGMLEDAIRLCGDAAKAGHPKALFRLGFFHEFYMERTKGEAARVRRAFECYWRVCDLDDTSPFTQLAQNFTSTTLSTIDEYDALKKQAGLHILDLFAKYPHVLDVNGRGNAQTELYKSAKARLTQLYGKRVGGDKGEGGKKSRSAELHQILSSCLEKGKKPLFGLYLVDRESFVELLNIHAAAGEKKFSFDQLNQRLDIRYLEADQHGGIVPPITARYFNAIPLGVTSVEELENVKKGEYFYLYFFNSNVKCAPYLNNKKIELIKNKLENTDDNNDNDFLCNYLIGKSPSTEFLLHCEDIVYWMTTGKKVKNVEECTTLLVQHLCGEDMDEV